MKLAYAMCGSFCTHKKSVAALARLSAGNQIIPALSEAVQTTDTRFGKASDLRAAVCDITGNKPITTVKEAEEIITGKDFDCVIVSPCTGNTLAKIANGITDSAVTMCVKAQLRSRRPVLIALATNDGLSANLFNIALTLEKKNIYFVPFGQDSPKGKPSSLVCDFDLIDLALEQALLSNQLQPILLR